MQKNCMAIIHWLKGKGAVPLIFILIVIWLHGYKCKNELQGTSTKNVFLKNCRDWLFSPNTDNITKIQWFSGLVAVKAAYYHPAEWKIVLVIQSSDRIFLYRRQNNSDQQCVFLDAQHRQLYSSKAQFQSNYLLHCDLNADSGQVPAFVFLHPDIQKYEDLPETEIWALEIENLQPRAEQYALRKHGGHRPTIALCCGLLYRDQDILLVLQFFEFYIYHGVTSFYLHKFESLPVLTQRAIDYYSRKYHIQTSETNPDFDFCSYRRQNRNHPYCAQIMQDNHCVLKTAFLFDFVVFCDFDELIQPISPSHTLNTWLQVNGEGQSGFKVFPRYRLANGSAFVFEKQMATGNYSTPLQDIVEDNLPLLHWINTTRPVQHLHYAAKLIVRPHNVQEISVHHVLRFYGNYENIRVNPYTEVFMHHFKNFLRPYWANNIRANYYQLADPYQLSPAPMITAIHHNITTALKIMVREMP